MKKRGLKNVPDDIIWVSKTELKNDMKDMQRLGTELCSLNKQQREKLPLNEEIQAALVIADKIRGKHDAYNRNIQFIAKQLFASNHEDVQTELDKLNNKHSIELIRNTRLEEIRDDLIAIGNEKIEELLELHEGFERQRMRQLVRQAAKEVKAEKPSKSFKELFKYLKQHIVFS